ncbi:hypothetical protein LUZ63_008923 [Rhynchospora breviuscula]|uniref:Cytochrome P450 n=1 Tax=Rhynchospora breviuscula TaxID=2022672 RepID=A0A9Q0CEE8_9POAL|nr:hypothetical protein LUZ63_008923 [Rhynchospora breviuscula]
MAWPWLTCTELILYISCLLPFLYYLFNIYFICPLSPNWPLVGMLPSLLSNAYRNKIHEWSTKLLQLSNGNFYFRGPWLSGMTLFVTADPANVHHIYTQNFQNYPKGEEYAEIFEIVGQSILTTDGDSWRFHREKLLLAMSRNWYRTFIAKMTQEKIENSILPFLSDVVEQSLKVVDLQDMLTRLSFDMTCILTFGTDPGSLSMEFPAVPFAQASDDATATIFFRLSRPLAWWKLLRFFRIGPEKKYGAAKVVIDRFIADAIKNRKWEMIEGKHVCPDLLYSYLCDENIPNSHEFLRDSVLSFLAAGRETVSTSLCWFFWALSQNKQIEEKIMHELNFIRHNTTPKGMVIFDPEELENLVYFKAAHLETLRLFPSLPFSFSSVKEPDLLPSGSIVTPGMKIITSAYAIGRMQKLWGKDCMDFKPERWISEKGTLLHVPSYKFVAFSTGPRSCVGKSIALTQMKMVAAAMLYNYRFELVEGHVVEPILSIVLHMKNGLMMRVGKRT